MHRGAHALCAPRSRRPMPSRGAFDSSGSSNNMAGLPHAEAAMNEDDGQCAVSRCSVPPSAFPPLPASRLHPTVGRGVPRRCWCCGVRRGRCDGAGLPSHALGVRRVRTGSGGAVCRRTAGVDSMRADRLARLGLPARASRSSRPLSSRPLPSRPAGMPLTLRVYCRRFVACVNSCRTRWCVW